MYQALYTVVWLISWLPLRVLYFFSDIFHFFIYRIFRYRRAVVRTNLHKSFPDKSLSEVIDIEKKFYKYFCDIFIEAIALIHLSESEMRCRMKFVNVEVILEQYRQGKSCMLMTAHYGNWEWLSTLSIWLPEGKPMYGIYKRLQNKDFDRLFSVLRMIFKGGVIEMNDLARTMLHLRSTKQLAMFGMISDQSPMPSNSHIWVDFLNQDTLTTTGTEVLTKRFEYPVYFAKVNVVSRGYYECEFIPISTSPKQEEEHFITNRYMLLLENEIKQNPQYWLWTHKRWKYQRS
jgi:Kdo2-lipid IVA lauroyltransferase/acyltransferase